VRSLLVAGAAVAALVGATAGSAHGPARAPGYISTVLAVSPDVLGLSATVLGGDDKLSVRNWSGKTVVVLDPRGAPMLRFTPGAVYRRAAGSWELVNRGTSFSWHDTRIHWSGSEPPDVVRVTPERDHMLGAWRIPATVEGRPIAIEGVIGWSAQPAGGGEDDAAPPWVVPVAVAGGLLAAAALALPALLQRRRRSG
jgi:hypothetical protein